MAENRAWVDEVAAAVEERWSRQRAYTDEHHSPDFAAPRLPAVRRSFLDSREEPRAARSSPLGGVGVRPLDAPRAQKGTEPAMRSRPARQLTRVARDVVDLDQQRAAIGEGEIPALQRHADERARGTERRSSP